jgi:hypothetical protein
MAINTGVNTSKLNGYAVFLPPPGGNTSKLVAYAILETPIAPVWPAFTFPSGVVTVVYSEDFDLIPASPPTTYTVVSGSLPPGLSLSNVSGDIGRISGTPTTAGTFTFTMRATNAWGAADKAFTITVVVVSGTSAGNYGFVA